MYIHYLNISITIVIITYKHLLLGYILQHYKLNFIHIHANITD